jgi:hypothetical protein
MCDGLTKDKPAKRLHNAHAYMCEFRVEDVQGERGGLYFARQDTDE